MLVGRDAERARIGALLEAAHASRSGALVIRGEPGIGKTALLEDARQQAAGMHVLTARGLESESELPFAGLHQLLRPALGHLDALPPPQAYALGRALGLKEGAAEERFLVSAASLSLLSELSEQRPVLCLVDDANWLDAASTDALLFVARRLGAEGIAMLFAAREGDVREFAAPDVPSMSIGGLSREAAAVLITRSAGTAAAAVQERLIAHADGNALALAELPTALSSEQLAGSEPLPEALPLTRQMERVFLERIRRLPKGTQRLLLIASAHDEADARLVMRAAEIDGAAARDLDAAEQAKLVSVHGTRLEFRHPLVRSAVYGAATFGERRAAHAALAEALAGQDEQADRRAWHLAASTLGPDEQIARYLDDAADRAAGRSGYIAAAKALVRAAELSVGSRTRGRRLAGAARAASIAGADDYAVGLANQALPDVDDPLLLAEIGYAIGVAEVRRGRPLDGLPRLVEAARNVSPYDQRKSLELLFWATAAATTGRDQPALSEIAEVARAVASVNPDDQSIFSIHALYAFVEARSTGSARDIELLDRVFEWAASADDATQLFVVAVTALIAGDDRQFEIVINRTITQARASGEFGVLAQALGVRAAQLSRAQRFDEAARAAEEAVEFATELGAVNIAVQPLTTLALVAAIRGDEDETRRCVAEEAASRTAHGLPTRAASAVYPVAMLDLGLGRWAEALERFAVLSDPRPEVGDAVLAKLAHADEIEAAVRAGRYDEAREALSRFEEWMGAQSPAWAQPRLACCRALLATSDEANDGFVEALRLASDARPFDLARIQLLYGAYLRRERRRADARIQLRAALEGFERLKAAPWAERTRRELRASGETARKRDPSAVDQLTAQELQIVGFVAEGLSNKDVAAQLYLSPRTIDYHLRNVFAKLGITSRTQLARIPVGTDGEVSAERLTPAR